MKIRKRFGVCTKAAITAVMAGSALWAVSPAHASSRPVARPAVTRAVTAAPASQICGNAGSGYCMNDWNNGGSGSPVKMYNGGYANDDFFTEYVDRCTVASVTPTCPFNDRNLDAHYNNSPIFQIVYAPNGLCVVAGASGGAQAALGKCANTNTGQGGANGVLQVKAASSSCPHGVAINVFWTNSNNLVHYLLSGGNPGQPLYLNSGSYTCWGGNGWIF